MDFLSNNQWIIILLPFLIVFVIGILLGVKNVQREKGIREEARSLGFLVDTQEDIKEIEKTPSFFLLKSQSRHVQFLRISNIINGHFSGIDFVLFDYASSFSRGRTTIETVLALPLPNRDISDFSLLSLYKVSSIHKHVIEQVIKSQLEIKDTQGQRIQFMSEPEFSKKYLLYSSNEQAIRKLFDKDMIKLLSEQSSKGWHIACGNGWMNLCQKGKALKPKYLLDFLTESKIIYDTVIRK